MGFEFRAVCLWEHHRLSLGQPGMGEAGGRVLRGRELFSALLPGTNS